MKIVITGALGHIGSSLIRSLAADFPDLELVLIDNLLTQRFCSLFDLPAAARYRFLEADVTSADLRPVFEGAHAVVHLAAMTEAAASFNRPEQVESNNYQATLRVSEACGETGARLFMPSSTSVYGTARSTVSEDCSPDELNPQSPYAATKLKEEQVVQDMVRSKGLRAVTCRFGTIFGTSKGMRFHTAVNKFCWQAVMGIPLTVWKTALDQRRPYLDLHDACMAVSFLIEKDLFDGGVFNILTLNATVRDIVETIREFVPDVRTNLVDSPIMNQFSYDVSCERFQGTGFTFTGDLKAGVKETVGLLRAANSARN
jgi:nucleoside-diphosphate-sugar epimerase